MPQTFVLPKQVGFLSGLIAPSSVLRFYQTGTSTPQNVYTDAALTNAVTSLTADAAGVFAKVYLNPNAAANYRVTLENSVGAVSYTEDDIDRQPASQAAIGAALYPRSAAENAAGVTPVNYWYPVGNALRYGTNTTPGTTDMTAALTNMLLANDGYQCFIPKGTYLITASLPCYNQDIVGENKENTVIKTTANTPIFINGGNQFIQGSIRNLTLMYGDGTKPTVAAGNDSKRAIYFQVVSGRSPNFWTVSQVEIRGAWWAYYDDSGSYAGGLEQVFARDCKNGFRKENGTTFHFDRCITNASDNAFFLNNMLGCTMTACANDGATTTAGNFANDFRSCTGLVINGWDSESNAIVGNDSAMFSFLDSTVELNGWVGYLNTLNEAAGFLSLFRFDDSQGTISGTRTKFNASSLAFTGSGSFYDVLAINDSSVKVTGSEILVSTGGTPAANNPFHATGTARIQFEMCRTDGTIGSNSYRMISESGSATGTLTGCTTSPTGSVLWTRNGNQVTLYFPSITATSNTTACTITGAIPASILPARTQTISAIRAQDNSVIVLGLMQIGTGGTLTLFPSVLAGAWTATGTKGIESCTVTYSLD